MRNEGQDNGKKGYLGRCLCGEVCFEIAVPPGPLVYCHCSQCRKAQGSVFSANVPVPANAYSLTHGHGFVKGYRSSEKKTRYFCQKCGSALYSHVDGANDLRVRAGTLDPDVPIKPSAHIFAAEPSPLATIDEALARYPAREPGR